MSANRLFCILGLLFLGMLACTDEPDEPIIDEALLDVVWHVDSVRTPDSGLLPVRDTRMWLEFDREFEVELQAGCYYFGTYEAFDHNSITIDLTSVLEDGCDEDHRTNHIYEIFHEALENVTKYEVTANQLILYDSNRQNEIILKIDIPDEDLLGVIWQLDSLETTDGKIQGGPDTLITLEFYDNWRVYTETDCQLGVGYFRIDESGSLALLTTGDRYVYHGVVQEACTDQRYNMDTIFFLVYEDVWSYSVDINTLTLSNDDHASTIHFSIQE